jgi:hypothetical protein
VVEGGIPQLGIEAENGTKPQALLVLGLRLAVGGVFRDRPG